MNRGPNDAVIIHPPEDINSIPDFDTFDAKEIHREKSNPGNPGKDRELPKVEQDEITFSGTIEES